MCASGFFIYFFSSVAGVIVVVEARFQFVLPSYNLFFFHWNLCCFILSCLYRPECVHVYIHELCNGKSKPSIQSNYM